MRTSARARRGTRSHPRAGSTESIVPITVLLAFAVALAGCGSNSNKSPSAPGPITYSRSIQPIFEASCVAGCHSSAVRKAGLDLTSWDAVIRGSADGEVLVPFHADRSHMIHLLMGMGADSMAADPMPVAHESLLTPAKITTLADWIDDGGRNDAGQSPYENSQRKIYVANQGSDEVSVIDLDALVVFRIVPVGSSPNLDGPHNVWIDTPKKRWYVTLINANPGALEQYDAKTDQFLGRAILGGSPANGVTSADGSRVYVTNWDQRTDRLGTVRVVDAATMTVIDTIQVGGRPHGIAISSDDRRLYTTNYYTDDISVVDLTLPEPAEIDRIPVAFDTNPLTPLSYQPNEAILSPDGRFLYVAIFQAGRKEVRVFDVEADSLYAVVPTGGPDFLEEISPDGSELYVADWGSNTVSVIRTADMTLAATLSDVHFSKPHGVAFSAPDGRYAFVTNENRDGTAPQHHPTMPGGRDGNLTIIDTRTRLVVKTLELGPVSAGIAVLQ